jgi:hypothetical protein
MQSSSIVGQPEPIAESPRSIDFDPTDFILLLGFGTFIFFYFSCPFLLPHFPMSFFTTYEYENIYQEFDHLLSIIIEGIREREREKRKQKRRGKCFEFFSLNKKEKQEKPQIEKEKKNKK